MSASLVGSEMCIRDRHKQRHARVCFARTYEWRSLLHRVFVIRPCSVSEAVSYTHLTLPTICSV
eukprot:2055642-Alexandrium_andersonii.AAC.1